MVVNIYNESSNATNPLEVEEGGEVDITGSDAQEDVVIQSAHGVHNASGELVLGVESSVALAIKVW